jgi:DNA polymerase
MTNPAQLKYLDAIGIPVWVSRDIVVFVDSVESVTDADDTGLVIKSDNSNKKSAIKSSGVSAVENILQGLNEQAEPEPVAVTPAAPVESSSSILPVQDSSPTANEIARTSSHIVYGSGSLQADWMVIGESPEINDVRQNQPYASESGVLLCNMLRAAGLENPRESAYLVNVIKSSMQAIEPSSIGELNKILNDKIAKIKPKMILVVGQLSAQNLLQSKEPLARLRAKAQKHTETDTNIVVTYYPSYLLSKPTDKRKAWEDLKLAMKLLTTSDSSGSTPE